MRGRNRIDVRTGGGVDPGISLGGVLKPGPDGIRLIGGVNLEQALAWNGRTCRSDAKGAGRAGDPREALSTEAEHRGRTIRSRVEGTVMVLDRRGCAGSAPRARPTDDGRSRVTGAKPFDIPKREVWLAFKRVKANQGAAGVDGQSIQDFEDRLGDNLYKLWNRLSSGSYMPPPVRRVDIPKASGGTRPLGIPTVADRVGQEVVRRYLEPLLEPVFHADSYGYRPRRSAIDAIRTARRRCWQYDWVVDIDIKGFFDSIDHKLLLRAVRKHTTCPWVLLYIERWLTAPVMMEDGNLVQRDRGTPQGGVISPLLANLFLHYVFDVWLKRACPGVPFERYADDIVCHCRTEGEALALRQVLDRRFRECGLVLHPEKTKLVYCKDTNRKGESTRSSLSSTSSAIAFGPGWRRSGGADCSGCHSSRRQAPRR